MIGFVMFAAIATFWSLASGWRPDASFVAVAIIVCISVATLIAIGSSIGGDGGDDGGGPPPRGGLPA